MRLDLPAGTVTLLFTDIEGSTRLIEALGEEGYVHTLAEHRRLLRGVLPSTVASRSTRRGTHSCTRSPILNEAIAYALEERD